MNDNHFYLRIDTTTNCLSIFNDPMLSIYLYNQVDKQRFKSLKNYFKKHDFDLSGFQQVTRKFTDVFKIPHSSVTIDASSIKKKNHIMVLIYPMYHLILRF